MRTGFHDFMDEAQDELGMSYTDSLAFYREVRDQVGHTATVDDLYGAIGAPEEYEEPREVPEVDWFDDLEPVEWDFGYVEDYWLDAGEEVEITAEFVYEEAGR